jgi:hypothetical protein
MSLLLERALVLGRACEAYYWLAKRRQTLVSRLRDLAQSNLDTAMTILE